MEFLKGFSVTSLDDYEDLFKNSGGALAIGEVSPLYLHHPTAAANIYSKIPNVRLIAILRNPIDRAYSRFLMMRRDGREPFMSFTKAIKKEQKRKEENWEYIWQYVEVGFYSNQLKRYYDLFKKDQILVIFYEDLERDPVSVTKKIFKFIGVDDGFTPDTNERYNVSTLEKVLLSVEYFGVRGWLSGSFGCFSLKACLRVDMILFEGGMYGKPICRKE